MFLGEYLHTLDTKKRISLPVKFRKEVGKTIVITRGLDNCLFVYSRAAWHTITKKLEALSIADSNQRGFSRFMLSGAVEATVDSVGRVLIPDFLKDFARLKNGVVLAGAGDRIEIWDEKGWKDYKRRIEKQADAMADKLGSLGVL